MELLSPQILLIHTSSQPSTRYGALVKAAGRTAPLGIACLAATFPDQIGWMDLRMHFPEPGHFEDISRSRLKACLVQPASDWSVEHSCIFLRNLRFVFPNTVLAISGQSAESCVKDWDLTIFGTGYSFATKILSGEKISSKQFNSLNEDLLNSLSVPSEPLMDRYGYAASIEKWDSAKTISVYQPWLGISDRSREVFGQPTSIFLSNLVPWLNKSGYYEICFEGAGMSYKRFDLIRQICHGEELPFSIMIEASEDSDKYRFTLPSTLKRVWLRFPPDITNLSQIEKTLEELKKCNISVGLRLDKNINEAVLNSSIINNADQLSIENPASWQRNMLRKLLIDIYWRRGNFVRHLWGIKSLGELTRLLRGAYGLLEMALDFS